jgi:hypothetical protein
VWNQKVRLTKAPPADAGTTHPVEYLKKQARIGFGFFQTITPWFAYGPGCGVRVTVWWWLVVG